MTDIIYVSGPYTSDPWGNTETAMDWGNVLLDLGFTPIVPHLSHFWNLRTPRDYETWMCLDLGMIPMVDAVFRFSGLSAGADREVNEAENLDIPVYYYLLDLVCELNPTKVDLLPEAVLRWFPDNWMTLDSVYPGQSNQLYQAAYRLLGE